MARGLISRIGAVAVFAVLVAGAAPAAQHLSRASAAGSNITIGMGYIPNVQFAPYYVAAQRGYYRAAGLNVTFNYALSYNLLELVGAGKTDVANADGTDTIVAVSKKVPIVYVMSEYQRFPVCIFAQAKEKIHSVGDLRGKSIGIPGRYGTTYVGLLAALRAAGLTESDVHVQVIGYTQVTSVAAGKVQAAVGYCNNEPLQLQRHGYKVTVLAVSDVANLVAPGLIVGKALLAHNPSAVRAFVQATLRGLADTIADPRAAFAICLQQPGLKGLHGSAADDQYAVLLKTVSLWHGANTRAHGLGYSDPAQWSASVRILREIGQLSATPAPTALYSNTYVAGAAKV
jgi:NitT/TauT family transport system substrate-binding protein